MPGTAIGFPSGRAGRAGKRGGMRMMVHGIAKLDPMPFVNGVDGKRQAGATFNSSFSLVRQQWLISGITKNSAGTPLPGCTVVVYTTVDDMPRGSTVSDASGNYSISVDGNAQTRYCVAYLAGSPDVAGTTVDTLTPVLT